MNVCRHEWENEAILFLLLYFRLLISIAGISGLQQDAGAAYIMQCYNARRCNMHHRQRQNQPKRKGKFASSTEGKMPLAIT